MKDPEDTVPGMDRRGFLLSAGVGAIGLTVGGAGLLASTDSFAMGTPGSAFGFPTVGLQPPGVGNLNFFPRWNGPWVDVPQKAFGGFDFVLGYMAEGVQGMDPIWDATGNGANKFQNSSGLFEQFSLQDPVGAGIAVPVAADTGQPLNPVPSGVGGHEFPERSAEAWYRTFLAGGLSNTALRDDVWAFINWARRMWGLDFDDPAADGFEPFGAYTYQYPGSPDADNEFSLFSQRYAVAFNEYGEIAGYARVAPTLLAADTGYTVIFRGGKRLPNITGGTFVNGTVTRATGNNDEEWPGKVRDGGIWGGVVTAMDALADIQAVRRGERYFSTPDAPYPALSGTTAPSPGKRGQFGGGALVGPTGVGPFWGQWWRRVAPIVGIDVDDPALLGTQIDLNVVTDVRTAANPGDGYRPAARPNWPIGFFPRGTDFFWGNYDLLFGRKETLPLHYQSEVPTAFRPGDGVPETFPCDLCPNPGSAEIKSRQDMDCGPGEVPVGIGLHDSLGEVSGFPDPANPELDGQMTVGAPGFYGRVHGTSYPRSVREDGLTTYHFRNYLLWPPRLNTKVLGDPRQPNFGNINWTIPTLGFLGNPADPTGVNPPGNAPFN